MAVTHIARICLVSEHTDLLADFYCRAFGFEQVGTQKQRGSDFGRPVGGEGGSEDARAQAVVLTLGNQTLELLTFASAGRSYPIGIAGNDVRFQHFAIVVSDMTAAHRRLVECDGWSSITRTAPQQLPARSAGVTAFKFRDPEGHPLELLAFPPEVEPPYWQRARGGGVCLGIDHSAITVSSTARSMDFYQRLLGFDVLSRCLNRGQEQARLDNLSEPVVEVTALCPRSAVPPHLELLCYRAPESHTASAVRSCRRMTRVDKHGDTADDHHRSSPYKDTVVDV